MATKIKFKDILRSNIKYGVELVSNAVSVTMGPKGRNAIISELVGDPYITKDGVTVARSINLQNKYHNLGAKLVVKAASKTAEEAGDGTTTCTVLTNEIYQQGYKYLQAGVNPIQLKQGIDSAVLDLTNELKELAKPVSTDAQIEQVATISANNDPIIGKLIAQAFEAVGRDGVISVDESKTFENEIEVVNGMQYKRGFISPHFATDDGKTTADLDKPVILIYNGKIMHMKEILPILEAVLKTDPKRNILIIADDIEGDAATTLAVNKLRGILNVCAIRSPGFGDAKKEILKDIAVVTGGDVIDPELGITLEQAQFQHLGSADKVIVTKDTTTIIKGKGSKESVDRRITQLSAELEGATSSYVAARISERIARLRGGVAILKLGAVSEVELKEKKDRVDDALNATRAAIDEGIVPGAGTAFIKVISNLSEKEFKNKDQQFGYELILDAVIKPAYQILTNAGLKADAIISDLQKGNIKGYNVLTDEKGDLLEMGVIDPVKVERVALQNAASSASMLLTADVGIVDFPDTDKITPDQAASEFNMM